jgi:hypothetical protein
METLIATNLSFRFWHKADMPSCAAHVCFWGKADITPLSQNVR